MADYNTGSQVRDSNVITHIEYKAFPESRITSVIVMIEYADAADIYGPKWQMMS